MATLDELKELLLSGDFQAFKQAWTAYEKAREPNEAVSLWWERQGWSDNMHEGIRLGSYSGTAEHSFLVTPEEAHRIPKWVIRMVESRTKHGRPTGSVLLSEINAKGGLSRDQVGLLNALNTTIDYVSRRYKRRQISKIVVRMGHGTLEVEAVIFLDGASTRRNHRHWDKFEDWSWFDDDEPYQEDWEQMEPITVKTNGNYEMPREDLEEITSRFRLAQP